MVNDKPHRWATNRVVALALCCVLVVGTATRYAVTAKAAVATTAAIGETTVIIYMAAAGIKSSVTAGGAAAGSAAVSSAVSSYVASTGAAASTEAFLTSVAAGSSLSPAGVLLLSAGAVALLAGFAAWYVANHMSPDSEDNNILKSPVYSAKYMGSVELAQPTSGYDNMPSATWFVLGDVAHLWTNYSIKLVNYGFSSDGTQAFLVWFLQDSAGQIVYYNENPMAFVFRATQANLYDYDLRPVALSDYPGSTQAKLSNVFRTTRTDGKVYYARTGVTANSYSVDYQFTYDGVQYSISDLQTLNYLSGVNTLLNSIGLPELNGSIIDTSAQFLIPDQYAPTPEPTETESLAIPLPPILVPSGTTLDTLPDSVMSAVGDNSLTVGTPEIVENSPPVTPPPDWNPPVDGGSGEPTTPEEPDTSAPFLPADFSPPWDYVKRTLERCAEFIRLFVVTIQEVLPSSLTDVVWASVVLAVLFGMFGRFLG